MRHELCTCGCPRDPKYRLCHEQGLPDFHGEMMRLGSTFTDFRM